MPAATARRVFKRNNVLKVRVCDGTLADLKIIGQSWRCSVEQVLWAVTVTWINDSLRDRDTLDLPFTKTSKALLLKAAKAELAAMEEEFG